MKTPALYAIVNGTSLRAFLHRGNDEESALPSHLTELPLDPERANPKGNLQEDTDRPGRFDTNQVAGERGNLVSGEQHSLSREHRKRQATALAGAIDEVYAEVGASSLILVVPAQWKKEILSQLGNTASDQLRDSIEGDWTGLSLAEVEKRILG